MRVTKRSEPPDGSLILPGDLLTWTFTVEVSAEELNDIMIEDIFDDCSFIDMGSLTVSAPWILTVDPFNPCRLILELLAPLEFPGIYSCVLTAIAGAVVPAPLAGSGTVRNTANTLLPFPSLGNAVELTFGALLEGDVGDQVVGVPVNYQYDIVSGTGPFVVSLLVGILPIGLNISASGLLSGTPTVADDYNFTLRLTDANGNTFDLSDECTVV